MHRSFCIPYAVSFKRVELAGTADLTANAAVDGTFEAKVKQDFAQPQPSAKKDKTFLSSRTTFRVDCTQRGLAVKEIRAYAGADLQGDQVQKMTSSDKFLQWMDAPADTVYGKILDYVCLTGPAG